MNHPTRPLKKTTWELRNAIYSGIIMFQDSTALPLLLGHLDFVQRDLHIISTRHFPTFGVRSLLLHHSTALGQHEKLRFMDQRHEFCPNSVSWGGNGSGKTSAQHGEHMSKEQKYFLCDFLADEYEH